MQPFFVVGATALMISCASAHSRTGMLPCKCACNSRVAVGLKGVQLSPPVHALNCRLRRESDASGQADVYASHCLPEIVTRTVSLRSQPWAIASATCAGSHGMQAICETLSEVIRQRCSVAEHGLSNGSCTRLCVLGASRLLCSWARSGEGAVVPNAMQLGFCQHY